MAEFFKSSTLWVIDFRYLGRARRWFKAFERSLDASAIAASLNEELRELYADRAQLVAIQPANEEQEAQYLRGDEPKNQYCPTRKG
ncbi:MAG: hypothetical protein IV107_21285 [Paucibacter sp.]|nr:hypothetical protein [Roseateles sp.]